MIGIIISIALTLLCITVLNKPTHLHPNIGDPVEWWGPGEPKPIDENIYDFHINVSNKVIVDLYNRLNDTYELQDSLKGSYQAFGINKNLTKSIMKLWMTKYDWNKRLEFLHQFPHYKTNIRGLNIHFVHVKPTEVQDNVKVLPLLLIHGWPGSFIEFYRMIDSLTYNAFEKNFTFEVIVPSLPGFGFSDPATKLGMNPVEIAHIFKDLMFRLGHRRFYVQGGDWGSIIARDMAIVYPDDILGVHRNWCPALNMFDHWKIKYGSYVKSLFFSELEITALFPQENVKFDVFLETGNFHQHATRPDTIGIALTDSPLGLAAYIMEKFISLTNQNFEHVDGGGLAIHYDMNQLLDNVMIYWITNSITTSMRIFAEYKSPRYEDMEMDKAYITVPAACDRFRYDIYFPAETILREQYSKLIHFKTIYQGGHYPALEIPSILSRDIFEFVSKVQALPETVYRDL